MLTTATNNLPKAEPVGRLLLERRAKAPDIEGLEQTYAALMIKMVNEGKHNVMPAQKGKLSDEQIHVLTAYVWGLSNKPAAK